MATVKPDHSPIISGTGAAERNGAARPAKLPPLEQGDHLDQQTFHARYEAMPPGTRAELIGGVVHMPSPTKADHGEHHGVLFAWLWTYKRATPGTKVYNNASVNMGNKNEPQPDAYLLIFPGGQTHLDDEGWMCGSPELIGEASSTTESYDLHTKKQEYEQAGVKEYIVIALRQAKVFWFILRRGHYEPLTPGADGVLRSETFPGLWLDPEALLRLDEDRLLAVLQQGVNSPEHAAFVQRLAASRLTL
jgi:Uma2 family endonuclease